MPTKAKKDDEAPAKKAAETKTDSKAGKSSAKPAAKGKKK